jgi:hypothetical protein
LPTIRNQKVRNGFDDVAPYQPPPPAAGGCLGRAGCGLIIAQITLSDTLAGFSAFKAEKEERTSLSAVHVLRANTCTESLNPWVYHQAGIEVFRAVLTMPIT